MSDPPLPGWCVHPGAVPTSASALPYCAHVKLGRFTVAEATHLTHAAFSRHCCAHHSCCAAAGRLAGTGLVTCGGRLLLSSRQVPRLTRSMNGPAHHIGWVGVHCKPHPKTDQVSFPGAVQYQYQPCPSLAQAAQPQVGQPAQQGRHQARCNSATHTPGRIHLARCASDSKAQTRETLSCAVAWGLGRT